MKRSNHSRQLGSLKHLVAAATAGHYTLDIMTLHQGEVTLAWAKALCDFVRSQAGDDAVRCTWWNMRDLSSPATLAGAVSTAIRADLIVVSAPACDLLPLPFYIWVESWLPHRHLAAGALASVLGVPAQGGHSSRVRDYLRAIAKQARMDFLSQDRPHTAQCPGVAGEALGGCHSSPPPRRVRTSGISPALLSVRTNPLFAPENLRIQGNLALLRSRTACSSDR